MLKNIMSKLAVSAMLGCVITLSGCGGGSSGSTQITAQADFPSSATANSTFAVDVSITSTAQPTGSLSVQVVDVGSAMPLIDCGAAQMLTVGGAAGHFTCTAPAVTLGSSNVHQLQITVGGQPNLSTPASVTVLNGGLVTDDLTDSSHNVITAAMPGQTFNVTFSTTSNPLGIGNYTVTAPSGWQVMSGGVCSLSGGQGSTCDVEVTVPSSAQNGPIAITIASAEGSSQLESDSLPLSVQAQPPTKDMTFQYAQNISDTLYANLPSQATVFTYIPEFVFKNTSGKTLNIDSATVLGLTSLTYTCDVAAPSSSPNCSLADGKTYTVDGDLNNTFSSVPQSPSAVSISIGGSGATYVQQDATITFVQYMTGLVAMHVVNHNGNTVYVAASYTPTAGLTMIDFDSNGVGTLATSTGANYKSDQTALSVDGGVIYMPYGNSGAVYVTRSGTGFNSEPAPSPTGSPTPPAFVEVEVNYLEKEANQPATASCPLSAAICEALTTDQTYVNYISELATISTVGNAAPLALNTQAASFGVISNLKQSEIFSNVESYFDGFGAPWQYAAANGTKNFIQKDANGNITAILAPITVDGVTDFDPISSGYYDEYAQKLSTYLETTPIYVDASGVSNSPGCVLEGQVATSGANSGKLVFSYSSGTCAPTADSLLGTMMGNECGFTSDGHGGYMNDTQECADTPDLVFDTFNDCDFLQAAGSLDCHELPDPTSSNPTTPAPIDRATFFENQGLWGPNGTYRAVVGRAIAAYQAIGLLPQCLHPTRVMTSANATEDVNNGLGFKNPSCLSGLTTPTFNAYAGALLPYVNVYTYSYGDFLGHDGTVTYSYAAFPVPLANNIPRAQPITVTLR